MSPHNRSFRLDARRLSFRPITLVPLGLFLFLLTLLIGTRAISPVARAQGQEAGPLTNEKPPKEVLALFDDLDDIDKLRVLNPLKLTPDQIDKLIAAHDAAQALYEKKAAALVVPPVKLMAQEIRATKRRMLAGGDVPKAFDDKVKVLQDNYFRQRDKLNVENWTGLIAKVEAIMTEGQVSKAIQLAKDAQKAANGSTQGEDAKWFNLYVLQVFINYPRIVPLLQEMKTAATRPAGEENGAGGDSGASGAGNQ